MKKKINNNRVKKIDFLHYIVNERFILGLITRNIPSLVPKFQNDTHFQND